ncbi:MAG: hypothetical protein S4CHLAM20_14970 [Chlamydiia bacterium]|nr:hypothetical protein [Chlamydiia bacterium]
MSSTNIDHTKKLNLFLYGNIGEFLDYDSFNTLSTVNKSFKSLATELSNTVYRTPSKIRAIYVEYATYTEALFTKIEQDPKETLSYLKNLLTRIPLGMSPQANQDKILTLFSYHLIIVLAKLAPEKYNDFNPEHTPISLHGIFEESTTIRQQVSESQGIIWNTQSESNKTLFIILKNTSHEAPPFDNVSFTNSTDVALKAAQGLTSTRYNKFKRECISRIIDSGRLEMAHLLISTIEEKDDERTYKKYLDKTNLRIKHDITYTLAEAYADDYKYENAFKTIETYVDPTDSLNVYIKYHLNIIDKMISIGLVDEGLKKVFEMISDLKDRDFDLSRLWENNPYAFLEKKSIDFVKTGKIELAIATAAKADLVQGIGSLVSCNVARELLEPQGKSKIVKPQTYENLKTALVNLCSKDPAFKISPYYIKFLLLEDRSDLVHEIIDTVSPLRLKDTEDLRDAYIFHSYDFIEEDSSMDKGFLSVLGRLTAEEEASAGGGGTKED